MMKKLLIAILGLTLLTSCGGESLNFNNPESYASIEALAKSNFGEEKEIYSFQVSAKDHLTSEVGSLDIDFLEDGKDTTQSYSLTTPGSDALSEPSQRSDNFQTEFFLKNKQGKIKIKDIDFQLINTKYDEALTTIADDYESFTLNSWEYNVDNNNEVTANFVIEATLVGEGTSIEGNNIVTNYYEFIFEMSADGTLTYKE